MVFVYNEPVEFQFCMFGSEVTEKQSKRYGRILTGAAAIGAYSYPMRHIIGKSDLGF